MECGAGLGHEAILVAKPVMLLSITASNSELPDRHIREMTMELRHLKAFVEVATQGSYVLRRQYARYRAIGLEPAGFGAGARGSADGCFIAPAAVWR